MRCSRCQQWLGDDPTIIVCVVTYKTFTMNLHKRCLVDCIGAGRAAVLMAAAARSGWIQDELPLFAPSNFQEESQQPQAFRRT
jgi:hypothetical protein